MEHKGWAKGWINISQLGIGWSSTQTHGQRPEFIQRVLSLDGNGNKNVNKNIYLISNGHCIRVNLITIYGAYIQISGIIYVNNDPVRRIP